MSGRVQAMSYDSTTGARYRASRSPNHGRPINKTYTWADLSPPKYAGFVPRLVTIPYKERRGSVMTRRSPKLNKKKIYEGATKKLQDADQEGKLPRVHVYAVSGASLPGVLWTAGHHQVRKLSSSASPSFNRIST